MSVWWGNGGSCAIIRARQMASHIGREGKRGRMSHLAVSSRWTRCEARCICVLLPVLLCLHYTCQVSPRRCWEGEAGQVTVGPGPCTTCHNLKKNTKFFASMCVLVNVVFWWQSFLLVVVGCLIKFYTESKSLEAKYALRLGSQFIII